MQWGQSKSAILIVIGLLRLTHTLHKARAQLFAVITGYGPGDQGERVAAEWASEINNSMKWNL